MVEGFGVHSYWAVILGGSSGLGLSSARKLAHEGMNLCIVHQNPRIEMDAINLAFDELRASGVQLLTFNSDVINPEKREGVLADLKSAMGPAGRVRCLLHSIAKGNLKAMSPAETGSSRLEKEDFSLTLDYMALSHYSWVQAVFDAGLFASDARVLAFTSEGSKRAWKHYAAVSAAKASLEAISRSIALEYASFGIRSNCIQAGITRTRSLDKIPGSEKLAAHSLERNPLGRMTVPEDVANVVYLLCLDEAAWINGTVIAVDGGEQIA